MASNNYTSANVVPSADTFREWVDLTNRITYDMEKVVVTVAANTQGARTSGNASVNGYFSANTLIVEHELTGATATGTVYGTRAAKDDLIIVSNTVLKANGAATGAILFAQSNAYFSGANVEFSSNVSVNSTSSVFSSNAGLNVFNTPIDANANVDIDNALTDITSSNLAITGAETNIDANTVFTANVNITSDSEDFNIGADYVVINSSATMFQSDAGTNKFNTIVDINANVDIDNGLVTITSSNTVIENGELNITSNVNFDAESFDILAGAFNVTQSNSTTHTINIDPTTNTFTTNAGLNVFNTPLDINANVDIDNALVTITSSNTVVENGEMTVSSNLTSSANATFTGANLYSTVANNALLSNVNIGQGATDFLRSDAKVVFNETLNVVKAVDFDATLNVDGATTLNGAVTLGDATGDDLTFTGYSATGITPKANGTLSLGTATLRWDGQFDDLTADDLTVDDDAGIGGDLEVAGATTLDGTLTVNTAVAVTYPASDSRTVIVGKYVTANDRIIIRSQVGNSSIGLLPLQGNNVPLGGGDNRWIITANSGAFSGGLDVEGDIDVNGTSNLDVVDIDGAVDMALTLNTSGAVTFGTTLGVTGKSTLNTIDASGLANLDGGIAIANATSTSITGSVDGAFVAQSVGTGTLTTSTTGSIGTTLSVGSTLGVTGATTLADTLSVAEATTLSKNVGIGGNITVGGTSTLGDAATDYIVLSGQINSNIIPKTNGNDLGASTKRWETYSTTVNTSGDITAGADVDITGQANANTLRVRTSSVFETPTTDSTVITFDNKVLDSNNAATGADASISANSTQIALGIGSVSCANLIVSGTATLPSDTSLTLDTIGAKTVNAIDLVQVGSSGADSDTAEIIFGKVGGAGTGANTKVTFANAHFYSTFRPTSDNSVDFGLSATTFRSGFFGTSVVVGNTVANTTAVLAENVYATSDLIGNYSSDQKLKDNVLVIDSALNKVNNISGYSFTWNSKINDFREGTNDYGVIAQEIENILPDAVSINSQGNKTVNYNAIIPLLVEAVKELSAKVDYYMQADKEGDEE